ncbi:MAG: deoxyribose-phosphate aldolase [Cytophagales bacterium]|nr:deoxyribose-phosphate aldolase [Cytophagales bacterium]
MKEISDILEISKMIDHSLLHPTMTDAILESGYEIAKKYNTATVCVKPYDVIHAVDYLSDSPVQICPVAGFPHGNSSINTKAIEVEEVIQNGADEVDIVVNVGKVLANDWTYVKNEIKILNEICISYKVPLKVIFENDYLPEDSYKIKLCEICSDLKVAFVKTSTGYGFVKQPDGKYSYNGATMHDLKLMRKHSAPHVQIKAAGGVRTLSDLLKVMAVGVTRIGATTTQDIVESAQKILNTEGKIIIPSPQEVDEQLAVGGY